MIAGTLQRGYTRCNGRLQPRLATHLFTREPSPGQVSLQTISFPLPKGLQATQTRSPFSGSGPERAETFRLAGRFFKYTDLILSQKPYR